MPVESPIIEVFPVPPPPPHPPTRPTTDERTTASNPANPTASPFGWHDTNGAAGAESTLTTGNNVNACTDRVAPANTCDPGSQPDGTATLTFTPALDLTTSPTAGSNPAAAVVNLFYWSNIIHDVEYLYGFNEVAGNFQLNNYGNGGAGNDHVQADAQDNASTCNANFLTLADGQQPRMQMFLSATGCWAGPPVNDGDLDNLVIVHEYGHGISNRLVGGPANVSCLQNSEQPGEGLSDWWGLSLTALPVQTGTTLRGTGTWLFYDDYPNGIRPQPYSTDPAINSYTYDSIDGLAVPHGVGSVWAQIYWEVYWKLVDAHGFNPNFYNYTGTLADDGNIRAKRYIIEGLKAAACSPGFVDVRTGILTAAAANYGGEDVCRMWEAFAAIGLGFDAIQGSSGSTSDQTNGFAIPTSCSFVDPGADARVCAPANHVQSIGVGPAYTSPPVDMSASGNPAGTTVNFSVDPVPTVPGTTNLTIGNTGAAAAGTYTITVTGDDGVNSQNETFDLTIDVGAATAPTLVAPADDATGVSTSAVLDWADVAAAQEYDVQVDDNSDFSSPVFTTTVTLSTAIATGLGAETEYFWRVRSVNTCGDGSFSAARSFTTAAEYCQDVDLPIPDSPAPAVTSTIVIPAGASTVTDIDVELEVTHTWVGDLIFRLDSPDAGTNNVTIVDRPGVPASTNGCSNNNIDATLNDEGTDGAVETTCLAGPPAIVGNLTPNNPLSGFDGDPVSGTWTLSVEDEAGADTGMVTRWCLVISQPLPDDIFADDFEVGNTSAWDDAVGD
jgi:subtilisin-like proprotein convertase family protein